MRKLILLFTILTLIVCVDLYGGNNGKITYVKGNAYILQYSNSFKKSLARTNQSVAPQDIIQTEKGAAVKIRLADGSEVVVKDNSRVQFAYVSKKSQRINVGTDGVLSSVNKLKSQKGFNVNTPTSVAGVRGTKFIVEYDETKSSSSVDVYEGKVELGRDKENSRMTTDITAGSALSMSSKDAAMIKRTSDPETLKNYEAMVEEAAASVSGWEYN